MLTQPVLPALFVSPEPRRTRTGLPPIPALLLTEPSATLTARVTAASVSELLMLLIDGASNFTDGDRELTRRLFEIVYADA